MVRSQREQPGRGHPGRRATHLVRQHCANADILSCWAGGVAARRATWRHEDRLWEGTPTTSVPSVAELERILGTTVVQLVEVSTVAELIIAVGAPGVVAVALDAPQPGQFSEAVAAAGALPVLRPLRRRQRNSRGEIDEVFDGYGLLAATDVMRLADGELSTM